MIHPKQLLNRYGIEPKKSLGQNFLLDGAALNRIVAAANVGPGDHILEIGPGLGALTHLLAVAIELDGRLLPILEAELAGYQNLTLVQGDILEFDPADWFSVPYKVVSNVPYYITGAILRHLLSATPQPARVVLTVQKEVAERITAAPPRLSLLAVSVQFYGQVTIVDTIKAGAFWPRPDVDSAVVRIDLHPTRHSQEALFFQVARAGFSQRRKQLKNNLRSLGYTKEQISTSLERASIDGRRRAETLYLDEWEALTGQLSLLQRGSH
jgi:16S rRNA (adenine1518-N6/adenine1519-N6)-dimethyltransferase